MVDFLTSEEVATATVISALAEVQRKSINDYNVRSGFIIPSADLLSVSALVEERSTFGQITVQDLIQAAGVVSSSPGTCHDPVQDLPIDKYIGMICRLQERGSVV